MNEEVILTVIDINNRCIEELHHGNLIPTLSELHEAMVILKQGVAITDSSSQSSHLVGVPASIATAVSPQSTHVIPNNHQQQQSAVVSVRIQFQRADPFTDQSSYPYILEVSTLSTPIIFINHLVVIIAVDRNATRSSMVEQQNQSVNDISDTISTEDLHLLSAAILYNMGLLFQQYANTCHLYNQNASQSATILFRASKIYELLIQLCSHRNIWNTSTGNTLDANQNRCCMRMIQTIAYNNYSNICYKLGNYNMFRHCMNVVQYQLIVLSSSSTYSSNENMASGEEEILNELRLNTLVAKLFPVPTLASAA